MCIIVVFIILEYNYPPVPLNFKWCHQKNDFHTHQDIPFPHTFITWKL